MADTEKKGVIDFDAKMKEVEDAYQEAANAAAAFNQALIKMRSIKMPTTNDQEELTKLIEVMKDLDLRTSYLLRMLLVQHGNVLFL